MKLPILLFALMGLAGCASPSGGRAGAAPQSASNAPVAMNDTEPRFEFQLDVDNSAEGARFLQLTELPPR